MPPRKFLMTTTRTSCIRTTLMTFNDANMTNNYSVFLAKA